MSFYFACRQPPVKQSFVKLCLRFCMTGAGPTCFPICKRYWFPAPPSCTIVTCNEIGVSIHHVELLKPSLSDGLKCHVLLMARNSLLPVWDTYVEELTEAKEPRLRNSPPAAATESYIQDTRAKLETPLARPPGGPLGCPFLFFLLLWHFFQRNHDSCSAVTFSEPPQETCLYGAYVESYVGYQFVRQYCI